MDDSSEQGESEFWESRRIDLAPAELRLLFKVCQLYKARLPTYLRSTRAEVELIESVLKKIA